jgi:two-component system, OmpR family, phosphate regulon response regulator PhoB
MPARILVVEDDEAITALLRYTLEQADFAVTALTRGDAVADAVETEPPDLIVLDWGIPGISGLEVCRRLRAAEATRTLPILMLTARGEEQDRVRGLTTGADDYVVKPFSPAEVLARIKGLLRRARPERVAGVLRHGELELDRDAHRVTRGGRAITLGPTEFRLLEHLMESPARIFSRAQLLDAVWSRDSEIEDRTVDVHVGRLRAALIRGSEKDPIRTVRGTGYGMEEP